MDTPKNINPTPTPSPGRYSFTPAKLDRARESLEETRRLLERVRVRSERNLPCVK